MRTPEHYKNTYQTINIAESWDLNFDLGSIMKYLQRAGRKNGESAEKDLNKALRYAEHYKDSLLNISMAVDINDIKEDWKIDNDTIRVLNIMKYSRKDIKAIDEMIKILKRKINSL